MIKLNHKDLNVYKSSIELVTEIYRLTQIFPKTETFGISSQMRRASISVPRILRKVLLLFQRKNENDFMK